ncbi:MAG: HlyD family efflux transporter periplasmic adaptor subunit [Clostridiales bacterium]|nr:HlyD family efflux transporter periplasmic adaptor subunit [Clostridiales bacterium]
MSSEKSLAKQEKNNNKKKSKLGKWIKKHKVLTTIICIVLVVTIGLGIFFGTRSSGSTTTLSKGSLENSASATGSVSSANSSTVSTNSTYAVKEVLVSVGDDVSESDVICTLDSSDIEEQIENEQEQIEKNVASAQKSYDSAKSSYDTASDSYTSAKSDLAGAEDDMNDAYTPYAKAKKAILSYQSAYEKALNKYNTAGSAYVSKATAYNTAISNYNSGKISASKLCSAATAYMKAIQNYCGGLSAGTYDISDSSFDSSSAQSGNSSDNSSSSQMNSSSASSSNSSITITTTAKAQCKTIVAKVKSLCGKTLSIPSGSNTLKKLADKTEALSNAKQTANYSSLESAYISAESVYETAESALEQAKSNLEQAESSLDQAEEELENAFTSDTLTQFESELDECTLTALQDGTITSLNATVGSSVQGSVATIVDKDNLKVDITISEADINNVEIGMSCYITSDATDDTLNGTLTQIDPTSSESGSFGAEVTVDDSDTGLLIGMNASVSITISSTEDVFQVPIDAVENDDDGDFVYRSTGGSGTDMEFEKVYVTTGEQNDYYIEISSDDLTEGDVIHSSSDLSEGIETVSSDDSSSDSGFSLASLFGGGNGGGDMPSGDFNSSSGVGRGNMGSGR